MKKGKIKNNSELKKKGLSPVVATVLLVAIVVILALLIFLWLRNAFVPEIIEKYGEDVQIVCERVQFTPFAKINGPLMENIDIEIANDGNVPIQNFVIKIINTDGSSSDENLDEIVTDWNIFGLDTNRNYKGTILSLGTNAKDIVFIPILRGSSKNQYKDEVCDEKLYGHKIEL